MKLYLCIDCGEMLATNKRPCTDCGSEQIVFEPDYEWYGGEMFEEPEDVRG